MRSDHLVWSAATLLSRIGLRVFILENGARGVIFLFFSRFPSLIRVGGAWKRRGCCVLAGGEGIGGDTVMRLRGFHPLLYTNRTKIVEVTKSPINFVTIELPVKPNATKNNEKNDQHQSATPGRPKVEKADRTNQRKDRVPGNPARSCNNTGVWTTLLLQG